MVHFYFIFIFYCPAQNNMYVCMYVKIPFQELIISILKDDVPLLGCTLCSAQQHNWQITHKRQSHWLYMSSLCDCLLWVIRHIWFNLFSVVELWHLRPLGLQACFSLDTPLKVWKFDNLKVWKFKITKQNIIEYRQVSSNKLSPNISKYHQTKQILSSITELTLWPSVMWFLVCSFLSSLCIMISNNVIRIMTAILILLWKRWQIISSEW